MSRIYSVGERMVNECGEVGGIRIGAGTTEVF
jgi:hypothetical protein